MTLVANQDRVTVDVISAPIEIQDQYAVINNPDTIDTMIGEGKVSRYMEDRLKEPLFNSLIPGPALRFMKWTNETNPNRDLGPALMVHRTMTVTPWRTIETEEQATYDDGRRPNG